MKINAEKKIGTNRNGAKIKRTVIAMILALLMIAGGILGKMTGCFCKGNYGRYAKPAASSGESALSGKTVLFLGSSVTYGYGSMGKSFVDYLAEADGINAVKEAVSGTTLSVLKPDSYVSRLQQVDTDAAFDAFVCQLSTNDATRGIPLGTVSGGFSKDGFDTATVAGAIEYIVAYVTETWRCPILFYTQARYDSDAYGEMVRLIYEIQKKWGFEVLDLWNNEALNAISDEERRLYLVDAIHPTKAGYRDWWLPEFRDALSRLFEKQ